MRRATISLAFAAALAACAPDTMPAANGPSPGAGGKTDDPFEGACEPTCASFLACIAEGGRAHACAEANMCEVGISPCETLAEADARKAAVEARRDHPRVMLHRGFWAFAAENTLEAYRATFELGVDGNEIDVRMTSDARS